MPDNILVSSPVHAVVTVTLNRPQRKNALSVALRDEVSDALDVLAGDERVKAVVLTGAGDVFSAGFDLKEFEQAAADPAFQQRLWTSSDRFHHTCLEFPLPLVAAVNGPAIAGGFDLAVLCDLRVAATTAAFSHPERTFADVVYRPLRELVGGALARELVLTGRVVRAAEALRLRLVSSVVPPAHLAAEAARLTALITNAPRDRLLRTKAKLLHRAAIPRVPTLEL